MNVLEEEAKDENCDAATESNLRYCVPNKSNLSYCDSFLGDKGCSELMRDFSFSLITNLDLRGNNIGFEGIRCIADMLHTNKTIQILSLEWNVIGSNDAGVGLLAACLEVNSTLKELDIRNNRIGPEGASAVARAMKSNTGLCSIDIRWNEIGTKGGNAFLQSLLNSNKTLCVLKLCGNGVSLNCENQINEFLDRNENPGIALSRSNAKMESIKQKARNEEVENVHRLKNTNEASYSLLKNVDVLKSNNTSILDEDINEAIHAERIIAMELTVRDRDVLIRTANDDIELKDKMIEGLQEELRLKLNHIDSLCTEKKTLQSKIVAQESSLKDNECQMKQLNTKLQATEENLSNRDIAFDLSTNEIKTMQFELQQTKNFIVGLKTSLESSQIEKAKVFNLLEVEKANNSKLSEKLLREELAHENKIDELINTSQSKLAEVESRLKNEIEMRAHDVRNFKREHEAAISEKAKQHALHVTKLQDDFEGQKGILQKQHLDYIQDLEEKHQLELATLNTKHHLELDRECILAAEQAVESALDSAVKSAVTMAVQDMEVEHKHALWKHEQSIQQKYKDEMELKYILWQKERDRLEGEIKTHKNRNSDLKQQHEDEMNKLQDHIQAFFVK